MKKTESEEEHNGFNNAVKSHLIIPIWLTSHFPNCLPQRYKLNRVFERATDMSRAEPFSAVRKF